jgi:hypothetical protein
MTSWAQFQANRRSALRSTGPRTEEGKNRCRTNAVRHGLTAETVIGALEDVEDYKAFEWCCAWPRCFGGCGGASPLKRTSFKVRQSPSGTNAKSSVRRTASQVQFVRAIPCSRLLAIGRAMTHSFLRLTDVAGGAFELLNRYEARLWRQAVQTLRVLQSIRLRWLAGLS